MIFKQKVQTPKIIGLIVLLMIPLLVALFFLFLGILKSDLDAYFTSALCVSLMLVLGLLHAPYLQWFVVYEDRIIVKNIFKTVNEVKFSEVKYVLRKQLPIFTRDEGVMHYIFVDGRPNKKKGITYPYNTDNFKNITVRMPVSEKLTALLKAKAITIISED